jgi:superfamily II DNA/RNA helicase
LQKELSVIVNEFILKRGNILNAQHLPPKLVQFVCCRLTPVQEAMYERLLSSKEIRHIREGKQTNTLNSIRQLINICSHPKLILESYQKKLQDKEPIEEDLRALVELIPKTTAPSSSSSSFKTKPIQSFNNKTTRATPAGSSSTSFPSSSSSLVDEYVDPEQSGKMTVLFRMMQAMRATQNGERIVIVSNYTSTLDLIEAMCKQNKWPALRLDGTISSNKRTKLIEEFNSPVSGAFAFLLSSKAGGCGINLIGGNRLVLFDPDWNPASDKQAAGRIWREGQKKRCFIYRFMSTGSIEEKIIQRQLSKEGLTDIVDDKEQVNTFSTEELKQLFQLKKETKSDTHDTLKCNKCAFMKKYQADLKKGKTAMVFQENQKQACLEFLNKFENFLQTESSLYQKRLLRRENSGTTTVSDTTEESSTTVHSFPFRSAFESLKEQLVVKDSFANLTQFSRKQREIIQSLEKEMLESQKYFETVGGPPPKAGNENQNPNSEENQVLPEGVNSAYYHLFPASFSIYSEFLKQWTDIVPSLMTLPATTTITPTEKKTSDNNNEATGSEEKESTMEETFVEQEGCPEETDFNKWSHHCYAITCDDELFSKALGDDLSLVSFIFGLEINFQLLEMKELETKDENLRKKEQMKIDLEELNEKRRKEKLRKERKANGIEDSEDEEKEDEVDLLEEKKTKGKNKKDKKETKETVERKSATKPKKRKEQEAEEDEDEEDIFGSESSSDCESPIRESAGGGERGEPIDCDLDDLEFLNDDNKENIEEIPGNRQKYDSLVDLYKKKDLIQEPKKLEKNNKPTQEKKRKSELETVNNENKKKLKKNSTDKKSSVVQPVNQDYELDPLTKRDLYDLYEQPSFSPLQSFTSSSSSFETFWSSFLEVSTNWKRFCLPQSDSLSQYDEVFSKIPNLKHENISKFLSGVDYFHGKREFLSYLRAHIILNKENANKRLEKKNEDLHELLTVLLEREVEINKIYFPNDKKNNKIVVLDEEDDINPPKPPTKGNNDNSFHNKRKKTILFSDDEEEEEDLNKGKVAPSTVEDKKITTERGRPLNLLEDFPHDSQCENEAYFTTHILDLSPVPTRLPPRSSNNEGMKKPPVEKEKRIASNYFESDNDDDEENQLKGRNNKNKNCNNTNSSSAKKNKRPLSDSSDDAEEKEEPVTHKKVKSSSATDKSPLDLRTQPTPKKPPQQPKQKSSSLSSQSSNAIADTSQSAVGSQVVTPMKRGEWSCSICTFINKRSTTERCKMCG